jgi:hypothetical protein
MSTSEDRCFEKLLKGVAGSRPELERSQAQAYQAQVYKRQQVDRESSQAESQAEPKFSSEEQVSPIRPQPGRPVSLSL